MAKLNPLHTPDVIAQRTANGQPFDLDRGTGKTTAQQLLCLVWAINNPYTASYPKDQRLLSYAEAKSFCQDVKAMANTLGLRGIYVNQNPNWNISFGRLS